MYTSSVALSDYTGQLSIGNLWAPGDYGYYLKGQIDGFHISKGVARYTQNFTPSTKRVAADQYTKLLLYTDPAQGIQDKSSAPHAVTLVGNTQVDTARLVSFGGENMEAAQGHHAFTFTGVRRLTMAATVR